MCRNTLCTARYLGYSVAAAMVLFSLVHIIVLAACNTGNPADYAAPAVFLASGFLMLLGIHLRKSLLYIPVMILFCLALIGHIVLIVHYSLTGELKTIHDLVKLGYNDNIDEEIRTIINDNIMDPTTVPGEIETFWVEFGPTIQLGFTVIAVFVYIIGLVLFCFLYFD